MTGETKMEERVRVLERDQAVTSSQLAIHIEDCNKRGEFHTKLLYALVAGIMVAIVTNVFHIQFPVVS